MRLFVIIVLMALLPLRGWAGDGMAIRMASSMAGHHGAAPAQAQVAAQTSVVAEHADCVEHANMAAAQPTVDGDKTATGQASPDHCSTCPTCQACFTVGLLVPTIHLPAQLPRTSFLHDRAAAVFASADLAHSQKPPIS